VPASTPQTPEQIDPGGVPAETKQDDPAGSTG
jgi:hypothetical protein